jgi:hypothetical protein
VLKYIHWGPDSGPWQTTIKSISFSLTVLLTFRMDHPNPERAKGVEHQKEEKEREEEEDDDWMMMDDEAWDNLWQSSVHSISPGGAAGASASGSVAEEEPHSKRPRPEDSQPEPLSLRQPPTPTSPSSVLLWSASHPIWLDAEEAAAAAAILAEEEEEEEEEEKKNRTDPREDQDEEEAFPAGQGFDLGSPTPSLPRLTSTPKPWAADQRVRTPGEWPSGWSSPFSFLQPTPTTTTTTTRQWFGPPKGRGKKAAAASFNSDQGLATLSWADLVRRHSELLSRKGKMNSRLFNKAALDLLAAFAAQSPPPLPPSPSAAAAAGPSRMPSTTGDWATEKEALSHFRSVILNQKEMDSEELVARVCQYVESQLSPLLTVDEKKETLLKKSLAFVLELSPQLSLKTAPVIRTYIHQMFDSQLENLFAEIRMPEMPMRQKALLYRRMFTNLFDDHQCVSFAATNKALLGKLSIRDLYFLTFYACVTSRRHRGDNLLQLGCVGKCQVSSPHLTSPHLTSPVVCFLFPGLSSVGKSLLFESITLLTGHQLLTSATSGSSDTGCGRFSVG